MCCTRVGSFSVSFFFLSFFFSVFFPFCLDDCVIGVTVQANIVRKGSKAPGGWRGHGHSGLPFGGCHDVGNCRTCCNTLTKLQHTATHCNTLQHTATHCNTLQHTATHRNTLQHTATHCNTLQHTATHCNTLQHIAIWCNTPQHTATHCNTLQPAKVSRFRHLLLTTHHVLEALLYSEENNLSECLAPNQFDN